MVCVELVDRIYETAVLGHPSISLCVCTYCVSMPSEGENRIYQITKLPNYRNGRLWYWLGIFRTQVHAWLDNGGFDCLRSIRIGFACKPRVNTNSKYRTTI